jgi:hypothetical protein
VRPHKKHTHGGVEVVEEGTDGAVFGVVVAAEKVQ